MDSYFGITFRGNYNELRDSVIDSNRSTGVLVTLEAHHNLIDGNQIINNANHGISLNSTDPLTPSHNNTVTHNYIGTNPNGTDLGNGNKGIIIQSGSRDNYIFDNIVAYNTYHGIYLYGDEGGQSAPIGNRVISNTLMMNENGLPASLKRGALVSDRTHRAISNTMTTATSGFDNIIASNLVTGNQTAGIFNIGASPLISGNHIVNNSYTAQGYGIYNAVDFGSDEHPDTAADDILSVPYIVNNVIDGNSGVGIMSIDTAPARRYELLTALNNLVTNSLSSDVHQNWYAGVEVVTGTVTNTIPITHDVGVHIYKGDTTDRYDLGYNREVSGSVIWLDDSSDTYEQTSSWPLVREFIIDADGNLDSWMTHTVRVDLGVVTATVNYPLDGLGSTKPLSDYVGLPNYRMTGPYARYQIAEVNFTYDEDGDGVPDAVEVGDDPTDPIDSDDDGIPDYQDPDSDGDGIPDSEEGYGDSDDDGLPDYQDPDDDGDGIPTDDEDPDGDGDPTNDDTDNDGIPDYLDPDDDGDGIPSEDEIGDDPENPVDSDGDGIPDYLDPDDDGDGIPSEDDGDGIPSEDEIGDDPENPVDSDGDGVPDYLDPDDDGDGIPSEDEIGDDPENPVDSDGDGIPDYLDPDDDGDGIPSEDEIGDDPENPVDSDGDGVPDYLDPDDDGDGIPSEDEIGDDPENPVDSDGDGIPDYLDPDDDGDGIPSEDEIGDDPENPVIATVTVSPIISIPTTTTMASPPMRKM